MTELVRVLMNRDGISKKEAQDIRGEKSLYGYWIKNGE